MKKIIDWCVVLVAAGSWAWFIVHLIPIVRG